MWFGTNLKLQRQALQSISRYTTGSRTTICMYHVQSRWPLLGQQIGRDVQLKNVLTGRKKRGTRAIPHTKSRRVEQGCYTATV